MEGREERGMERWRGGKREGWNGQREGRRGKAMGRGGTRAGRGGGRFEYAYRRRLVVLYVIVYRTSVEKV